MPNCGNRMKKYKNISFHRLPLYNPKTSPLWLVVLQIDVQTQFELCAGDTLCAILGHGRLYDVPLLTA